MTAQIEEQISNVGTRLSQHHEEGVLMQDGDYGEPGAEFENAGAKAPASRRVAKLRYAIYHGRQQRRDTLRVGPVGRVRVNWQPVTPDDHHRVDTGAPAECFHDVPDRRHGGQARKRKWRSQAVTVG